MKIKKKVEKKKKGELTSSDILTNEVNLISPVNVETSIENTFNDKVDPIDGNWDNFSTSENLLRILSHYNMDKKDKEKTNFVKLKGSPLKELIRQIVLEEVEKLVR